jgi:hypothetical protein
MRRLLAIVFVAAAADAAMAGAPNSGSSRVSITVPPIASVQVMKRDRSAIEISLYRSTGQPVVVKRSADNTRIEHPPISTTGSPWVQIRDVAPKPVTYEIWQF